MNALATLIASVALTLSGCGKPDEAISSNPALEAKTPEASAKAAALVEAAETERKALKPKRDALLQHLKANEPKIKDIGWLDESRNSMLIGVIPNTAERRDGYAEYVCRIATEHKIYGGIVRIMDVTSAARDHWREIGRADCANEDQAKAPPQWVDFGKTNSQR